MTSCQTKRAGFTLVEIIVAIAVMLILAATITPSVLGILDKERIDKAAATLRHLALGITNFKDDVTKNPSRLTQLSDGITNQSRNSCGARFSNGEVNNYDGPYINRKASPDGMAVEIGTAQDLLDRQPDTAPTNGSFGELHIVVTNVTLSDAEGLNATVDGDGSNALGTVRWSMPPLNGYVELRYVVPIRGC